MINVGSERNDEIVVISEVMVMGGRSELTCFPEVVLNAAF